MRTKNRARSFTSFALLIGAACSSNTPPAASHEEPPIAASKETTEAIGVTTWEVDDSLGATGTQVVHGYDDARTLRASFHFVGTKDANGRLGVAITSDVQGPAKIELQTISDQQTRMLDNTFASHPDAVRTLGFLLSDIKSGGVDEKNGGVDGPSLLSPSSAPGALHVQDLFDDAQDLLCPRTGWGTVAACALIPGMHVVGAVADAVICPTSLLYAPGVGCIAALAATSAAEVATTFSCGCGLIRIVVRGVSAPH
jgi:hypothetical protein